MDWTEKKQNDGPPDFAEAYGRARRSYGLVSALLLGWELVGIRVSENPIQDVNISLETPAAFPFVLIALIVYFAFRFTVEWLHAHPKRRSSRAARWDFGVAHSIAVFALGVFLIQELIGVQILEFQWIDSAITFFFSWLALTSFNYCVWAVLNEKSRESMTAHAHRINDITLAVPAIAIIILIPFSDQFGAFSIIGVAACIAAYISARIGKLGSALFKISRSTVSRFRS